MYAKQVNQAPHVKRMIFTINYTCGLKNVRLTHGIRNMHLRSLEKP